jgi:hypothetical protein
MGVDTGIPLLREPAVAHKSLDQRRDLRMRSMKRMAADVEDAAPVLDGSAEAPDFLFFLEDQRISTVVIG